MDKKVVVTVMCAASELLKQVVKEADILGINNSLEIEMFSCHFYMIMGDVEDYLLKIKRMGLRSPLDLKKKIKNKKGFCSLSEDLKTSISPRLIILACVLSLILKEVESLNDSKYSSLIKNLRTLKLEIKKYAEDPLNMFYN